LANIRPQERYLRHRSQLGELAVAAQKRPGPGRPDLGGQFAREWFRDAVRLTGARLAPVHERIAFEAAEVATVYARKDPATAS
jgi:hypothetical protein